MQQHLFILVELLHLQRAELDRGETSASYNDSGRVCIIVARACQANGCRRIKRRKEVVGRISKGIGAGVKWNLIVNSDEGVINRRSCGKIYGLTVRKVHAS